MAGEQLIKIALILVLLGSPVFADKCLNVDPSASVALHKVTKTKGCHIHVSPTGYPLPDPNCTPGAINPTVTVEVIRNPAWRTACVRNGATTPTRKRSVYASYGVKPSKTCEIDHLVSIEIGGADTLDNLWPQCGGSPYWFRIKDVVENALAREVQSGKSNLRDVQRGIATDWSQFVKVR